MNRRHFLGGAAAAAAFAGSKPLNAAQELISIETETCGCSPFFA